MLPCSLDNQFIRVMQKKVILLVSLTMFTMGALKSQELYRRVKASRYDTAANGFLNSHLDVDSIHIIYINDSAKIVLVHRGVKSPATDLEHYDLSFDGDWYLFKKRYSGFSFPNIQSAKMAYLEVTKSVPGKNTIGSLWVTMKKDMLKYSSSIYTYTGRTEPELLARNGPIFKGNLGEMTKLLEQKVKLWKDIKIADSVIILMGWVDKTGRFGNLKIIEGNTSPYADKILEFMLKEATAWSPKIDGGRIRDYYVRISVRMNKDRSVYISIL